MRETNLIIYDDIIIKSQSYVYIIIQISGKDFIKTIG